MVLKDAPEQFQLKEQKINHLQLFQHISNIILHELLMPFNEYIHAKAVTTINAPKQ